MAIRPTINAPSKPASKPVTAPAKPIETKPVDLRQKIILPSNRIAKPAQIVLPPMGVAPGIRRIIIPEQMVPETQAESEYYRAPEEEIPEEKIVDDEGIEEIPEEGEESEPLPSDEAQEQEFAKISGGEKVGEVSKPDVRPVKRGVLIPDDYGNIRPPSIGDRSQKDFLESGACGTYVNVPSLTQEVILPAGFGPQPPAAPFRYFGPSQFVQVINIRTDDRKSIPLTISFDCSQFEEVLGGMGFGFNPAFYDFTALLRWGVEGASVEAEVDIRDGMTMSICSSSLTVSVGLRRSITTGGGLPIDAQVRIGAFVSKGAYGKSIPPQRTIFNVNAVAIPGASRVDLVCPSFARSFRLGQIGMTVPPSALDVMAVGANLFGIDYTLVGANQKYPVSLVPNGCTGIAIYPNPAGAGNFLTYAFGIFELGF